MSDEEHISEDEVPAWPKHQASDACELYVEFTKGMALPVPEGEGWRLVKRGKTWARFERGPSREEA